jgi:hypothetical protein
MGFGPHFSEYKIEYVFCTYIRRSTMTRVVSRRSLFLDHTDLDVYDVHENGNIAHLVVISGESYMTNFYFRGYRPFDVIEELLGYSLHYRVARNRDEYARAKDEATFIVARALQDRIVGEQFKKHRCVRVQIPSVSSITYYAIFHTIRWCVNVERGCDAFLMGYSELCEHMDPLRYEMMYVQDRDRRVVRSYLAECTSELLAIPYGQLLQCYYVKSAQKLDNVINMSIPTCPANQRTLRKLFAPKKAPELYKEAMRRVLVATQKYMIPPIADIVWHYLL